MGGVSFAGAARATMSVFFTIGHSTRTLAEFVDLLRESSIDLVVDVRSMPRSRTNPQFNLETLPEGLAPWQIGYNHMPELGGSAASSVSQSPHPTNFGGCGASGADYALTAPCATPKLGSSTPLHDHVRGSRLVALPPIITDYPLAAGEHVCHILGPAHIEDARLTSGAVVRDNGTVVYPTSRQCGIPLRRLPRRPT
jgi:uncharacterized protein DUF488